jgi:hypothetical protein
MSNPDLERFVTTLWSKGQFSTSNYAAKLESAVKSTGAMSQIAGSLPATDSSQKSATFDGQDCSVLVSNLGVATCAVAMNQTTSFGFSYVVSKVSRRLNQYTLYKLTFQVTFGRSNASRDHYFDPLSFCR